VAGEEGHRFNVTSWCVTLEDEKRRNILMSADTGKPVFLPFRMSCFVLSNLVVTAGMLTPGLGVRHRPIAEKVYTDSL
jgi:hypothetical protein